MRAIITISVKYQVSLNIWIHTVQEILPDIIVTITTLAQAPVYYTQPDIIYHTVQEGSVYRRTNLTL